MENAVEACTRIGEDGFRRFIRVGVACEAGVFAIKISNSTVQDVVTDGDEASSSKRGGGHGYGIESVKAIVERHGGGFDFHWSKSERVFFSDVTITIK